MKIYASFICMCNIWSLSCSCEYFQKFLWVKTSFDFDLNIHYFTYEIVHCICFPVSLLKWIDPSNKEIQPFSASIKSKKRGFFFRKFDRIDPQLSLIDKLPFEKYPANKWSDHIRKVFVCVCVYVAMEWSTIQNIDTNW